MIYICTRTLDHSGGSWILSSSSFVTNPKNPDQYSGPGSAYESPGLLELVMYLQAHCSGHGSIRRAAGAWELFISCKDQKNDRQNRLPCARVLSLVSRNA